MSKLFLRREFLQFASAAAVALPAGAQRPRSNVDGQATLDPGRWEEAARQRIEGVMRQLGAGSPGYDRDHPPYAVFDWNNTSIVNDTEEALLLFQIETFSFRIPSSQLAAVLRSGVPSGPFAPSFRNMAGHAVDRDALVDDIAGDYRELARLSPVAIAQSTQLPNFRAKLLFFYAAVDASYGPRVAYPWVIYLLSGYTPDEVEQLAARSNDRGLGSALEEVTFTSSEAQPGSAGAVEITHQRGLRITEEIAALMHTLRRNGFEVFASARPLKMWLRRSLHYRNMVIACRETTSSG